MCPRSESPNTKLRLKILPTFATKFSGLFLCLCVYLESWLWINYSESTVAHYWHNTHANKCWNSHRSTSRWRACSNTSAELRLAKTTCWLTSEALSSDVSEYMYVLYYINFSGVINPTNSSFRVIRERNKLKSGQTRVWTSMKHLVWIVWHLK